jgi:hypothetical protein
VYQRTAEALLGGMKKSLILAAAVAALAVGPATAGAATATLSIPYRGCVDGTGRNYDYTVRVQGSTRYYDGNHRVEVRLWGDDTWYDDFLAGPFVRYYGFGNFYSIDMCANASTLDEDWGEDEVYAGVRVYDSSGRQTESVESNRIVRSF